MAYEVGTASNLEDLFGKIVGFLTADANLVTAGQQWEALRLRRDNLLSHSSNLNEPSSGVKSRFMHHTFRYDPRSLNTDSPVADGWASHFYATNWSAGASQNTWRLRESREVTAIRIRAAVGVSYIAGSPRTFRLQHSDNGSSWTTALTVTNTPVFTIGEYRDFPVPSAPGSHEYWRIIWDAVQNSTTTGTIAWTELLLLEADETVANHYGSEAILRGQGNAGTDNIFVGLRSEYDAAAGWYNLFVNGYTGYDPTERSWFNQPGALPGFGQALPRAVPMIPCWNTSMPYWLVASGRSFRFGIKVSTSYEGGYGGFILPYATPGQYPYPLAVGGSLVPNTSNRSADWRYSDVSFRHGVYPAPGANSGSESEAANIWATLYLRSPEGVWRQFANRPDRNGYQPEGIQGLTPQYSWPFQVDEGLRSVWPHCQNFRWTQGNRPYRECLGGGYILQPCILLQRQPIYAVHGELEGTYAVSGYNNSAENTTTFNGKTHIILQNAYRNTVHEFWALSLDE